MSCGRCSRASSNEATPAVATVASGPACRTIRSASSRLFGSSSTTRIFAMAISLPSGLVRGERQVQREGGSEAEADAARGHRAAVGLDDEACHIETEADADLVLRRGGLDPSVLAKDHSDVRSREPDPLILDEHACAVVALSNGHVNGRPRRGEAERVIEDVLDRGAETFRICVDPDRV